MGRPPAGAGAAQASAVGFPSRLGRLVRSNLFAVFISAALHGAIFLSLYGVVFREVPDPARDIIPEARLAGGGEVEPVPLSDSIRLRQAPAPRPVESPALRVDAPPLAAVTLDAPPAPRRSVAPPVPPPAPSRESRAEARLFGQRGNAYKVAYVVDISASLWLCIDEIAEEMRDSIRSLIPTQSFHIVLAMPGGRTVELEPRRLVPATGRHKAEAMRFLDQISGIPDAGAADPMTALKRAFAAEPELIYFLTDGDYLDIQQDLNDLLLRLNPDRRTRITVIWFSWSPLREEVVRGIASRHGGNLHKVKDCGLED